MFRAVYLACLLWIGASAAQQGAPTHTPFQPPVQAPPASESLPAAEPPPSAAATPYPAKPKPGVPETLPPQAPVGAEPRASLSSVNTSSLNSLHGLMVTSVQVSGPGVEHPEWLEPLLAQKPHEPLDKYKVRESVQFLYNTGRFAVIQVEARRTPQNEIQLVFDVKANYFFGSILSEGAPGRPSDSQLVNASKLALGDLFSEDKIQTGIESMQRTLQEAGFFQASIQPFYEWDAPHQQVKVLFVVTQGGPARIGQVIVAGLRGYNAGDIAKIAHLKPGDRVTAGQATRALQRIRKTMQKHNRLEAQASLTQRVYHPQNNTLDYTFDITPGPIVAVKVEGAKISSGRVKRLVPVFEENAVDEDLLNEGKRNLQDYFQTKGYFDAEVEYDEKQVSEDRRSVIYRVDKMHHNKGIEIVIRGNRYFPRDTIRERMEMQASGGPLQRGLLSESLLAHDIAAIESLYRSNGFLQVKVTSEINDSYRGQEGRIQIVLSVEEGMQTTVGNLSIEGNTTISEKEIRNLIGASEGQPYSDSMVINDQTEVLNAYTNRGFPRVKFEYSAAPESGDSHKIDLAYKITEGPQVFVNQVLIAGLHYTRPFVVQREMKIRPGQPLSQHQMLDSQNGLYDMGIFNEVDMAVQNPEGDATHKNVNFQMSEARRYTFSYGGGLEVQTGQPGGASNPQGTTGVSPRVSFDVTRLNFRGRDQTLSLKTRYGNLEKLGLLAYTQPRFFDLEPLSLNLIAFYEQTNNVQTYTARRLEGSVEFRQNLDRATTLFYKLIYRRVSTSNLVINPAQVPLFSQPVRVAMPDFSYIRDTRDNPIDSRKGSFNSFDVGVATQAFGSEPNFARVAGQNSTYYLFHSRRWVFARSTRIGIEEPYGDTGTANAAPGPGKLASSSFIPLPERFLSGGATTLRSFGLNQAGPRDIATGLPLGGEALFVNNLELRTPPLPFPYVGNNLSAVLFNDLGNVWATPSDMFNSIYKFHQPNRSACLNLTAGCDFNYVSLAVGSGIRYRTPIGPVSFDLGYNLNPPAFSVKPAPPTAPFSQVLRHFNFFFNIGQTF